MLRLLTFLALGAMLSAACSRATGPTVGDMTLAAAVRTALVNDPVVGVAPIEVRVAAGIVTLTGRVATRDEYDRVLALVRAVEGVERVESYLVVTTSAPDPVPPEADERRLPALPPSEPFPPPRHFAVGGAVEFPRMQSGTLDGLPSIWPTFRFGRGSGLKPALLFTRFRADLPPSPGTDAFGDIRLTVVGAGLSYSVTNDVWSLTPTVAAAYSFNHIRLDPGFSVPLDASLPAAVDDSLGFAVNLTLWREVAPRVSVGAGAGYYFTRPRASWLEGNVFTHRRLNADAIVFGVRAAWWVF
jgi:hypothetical protein